LPYFAAASAIGAGFDERRAAEHRLGAVEIVGGDANEEVGLLGGRNVRRERVYPAVNSGEHLLI
jgi:hypothetical protein